MDFVALFADVALDSIGILQTGLSVSTHSPAIQVEGLDHPSWSCHSTQWF